jgi:hypothetical protein
MIADILEILRLLEVILTQSETPNDLSQVTSLHFRQTLYHLYNQLVLVLATNEQGYLPYMPTIRQAYEALVHKIHAHFRTVQNGPIVNFPLL